jgi:hypothetical protein
MPTNGQHPVSFEKNGSLSASPLNLRKKAPQPIAPAISKYLKVGGTGVATAPLQLATSVEGQQLESQATLFVASLPATE